jgi:hypothetical protein
MKKKSLPEQEIFDASVISLSWKRGVKILNKSQITAHRSLGHSDMYCIDHPKYGEALLLISVLGDGFIAPMHYRTDIA